MNALKSPCKVDKSTSRIELESILNIDIFVKSRLVKGWLPSRDGAVMHTVNGKSSFLK